MVLSRLQTLFDISEEDNFENTVAKGGMAHDEQFLLEPRCCFSSIKSLYLQLKRYSKSKCFPCCRFVVYWKGLTTFSCIYVVALFLNWHMSHICLYFIKTCKNNGPLQSNHI